MHFARILRCLAAIAAVTFALPLCAQSGTITGKVIDSVSGRPIPGARITVRGMSNGTAVTDANGVYRISNLESGTYSVTSLSIGYSPTTVTTTLSGGSATADLAMPKATILNQISVTETRGATPIKVLDSPSSISVVDQKEIATRPSLTTTDHLEGATGIVISRSGIVQSNVVARGFNNIFSGSLLTLQDYRFAGVPSLRVNVPVLFTGTNEDIERMEVLLGPASALYGPNSSDGVLHIITKSPFTSQGTTLTMDGGSHEILRLSGRHAALVSSKVGVKVSAEYMRGTDFKWFDPAEPDTFPASAPAGRAGTPNIRDFDVRRATGEARLDYRPDGRTEAVTTIGYTRDLQGIELTGANGAALAKNWSYLNVQERFRRGKFFAQAFLNYSDAGNDTSTSLEGTYLFRSGQPIVDKSRVYVAQVQHGFSLSSAKFTYGADYINTNPRTGHTINGNNEDIDDVLEYGAYIQGTVPLRPKWDFMGAARVDRHSELEGEQFSPRLALMFKPSQGQNWRATFNRSFSTPGNYAFFLDLIQASNVAGSGFDVRAVGNHGGRAYDRSCTGAAFGSYCMRTIYANGSQPASAAAAYQGLINARASAIQAGIAAKLAQNPATAANAAALAAAIVNGLKAGTPTNTDISTHVGYALIPGSTITPDQLSDIGPLKAGFNNTLELGYKGKIGKKGLLSVDAWYQQRGDINPPAGIATPSVFADSGSYDSYFNGNITSTLTAVFQAQGMPAPQAAGTAAAIAAGISPALAGQLKPAPLGTVTFAGEERPDVLFTYQSSDESIDIKGIDVAYDWLLTKDVSLVGTYSWVDKNVFDEITFSTLQGGNGKPYMSNTPKHRATLAVRYDNNDNGWGFEVRGRYQDAFPVNSGLWVSDLTQIGPHGSFSYAPVPVIGTLDLGASYRLQVRGKNVLLSLNGTNVLNNERPMFAGTAKLGALWMTRISYTF